MPITVSFVGSSVAPTVEKKSRSLIQFNDEYQANRFYSLLKERLKNRKWTMIDVDRFLMETYGNKYSAGEFSPTWKDWSHTIKPEDVILRSFGGKYATLYFKGIEDEEVKKAATVKDFKNELKESITNTIIEFLKENPDFDSYLIDDAYYMVKVDGMAARKVIIFSEVKE